MPSVQLRAWAVWVQEPGRMMMACLQRVCDAFQLHEFDIAWRMCVVPVPDQALQLAAMAGQCVSTP